jgi:uncharacterized membrane protein YphA (DoxX/SURF4 family)
MEAGAGTASPVGSLSHSLETPAWKTGINHLAAIVIAGLFLMSGVYKAIDPFNFAKLAEQLKVPITMSMPLALLLAVAETSAGVMLLVPRFRRWGGILASLLLLSFMVYMGVRYQEIVGQDCSCFPTIRLPFGIVLDFKRSVGPGFFYGDAAMLAGAALAAWWARPSQGLRTAAVIVGAVAVFTGVSAGMSYFQHNSATAPESITVNGQPLSLRQGKYFIFFFDPECSHCNAAAKDMGTMKWKSDVQVIGVATRQPQWSEAFMKDNNFNGRTTLDLEKLKAAFPFGDPPYGVLIDNGRQVGAVPHYEENGEPGVTLKKLGAIE